MMVEMYCQFRQIICCCKIKYKRLSEHTSITPDIIHADPWQSLKKFTNARIALGRTGTSIPLKETLQFKMDHANARDAVYETLNTDKLIKELSVFRLPVFQLQSKAINRLEYLQRPDLGRQLNETSKQQLLEIQKDIFCDIAIIFADGLSATAVQSHAVPLLQEMMPLLKTDSVILATVEQGRVAIGDEIGFLLHAKLSLVLIGERPGLSSPDSLGAYITYSPQPSLTDESRNCVSNIRPQGLGYKQAADKINYLIQQALQLKISGVLLKDIFGNNADDALLSHA